MNQRHSFYFHWYWKQVSRFPRLGHAQVWFRRRRLPNFASALPWLLSVSAAKQRGLLGGFEEKRRDLEIPNKSTHVDICFKLVLSPCDEHHGAVGDISPSCWWFRVVRRSPQVRNAPSALQLASKTGCSDAGLTMHHTLIQMVTWNCNMCGT